jgi:ketosteroid isomerase-like protein
VNRLRQRPGKVFMRHVTIISCLMFLLVAPLIADCSMADKKALEEFDRAWGDSATKGDRPALEQIYASDYMGMTAGNTLNRAETIDNQMRDVEKARGNPQPVVTPDYYIIHCTPNSATITHRNVITTNQDGHSRTNYARSVHFLEKRNGKWQVVSNAGHSLNDGAQVMYLEHEWNDAEIKGDASWFEKNFASDMTNISSRTGKITDKTEEMADFKSRKDVTSWAELSDLNARKEGDTVITTGINRVKGKDAEGKAFDRRVAFTDVWVKRDGRWQVLATQGTEVK